MDENQELIELLERAAIEQDARVNANTRGHVWTTRSNGHVDIHAGDFHNNVQCEKCGYVYCIACHDSPQKDCTK